ncbi:hypothetical protein SAMN05428949_1419 [Chitinophaga sp. YR627]|nr:hypothetical protein SAMN05428949_1419 [Chitinophaga sp. YR627]
MVFEVLVARAWGSLIGLWNIYLTPAYFKYLRPGSPSENLRCDRAADRLISLRVLDYQGWVLRFGFRWDLWLTVFEVLVARAWGSLIGLWNIYLTPAYFKYLRPGSPSENLRCDRAADRLISLRVLDYQGWVLRFGFRWDLWLTVFEVLVHGAWGSCIWLWDVYLSSSYFKYLRPGSPSENLRCDGTADRIISL